MAIISLALESARVSPSPAIPYPNGSSLLAIG